MPMVPTQTTQQDFGQIRPSYDTASASPDAFGAQIGAAAQRTGVAIEQASDVTAKGAIAFQGLQNETDAKNADIQLAAKLTALQFDPKNGYQGKLGKDAVDGYQGFQDAVQQAYQDARASLANPEAQRMFDNAAVRRTQYSLASGAQHASQQNKIWQVGTSEARAQLEMNTAANYYNDDNRFGQAIATIKDEAVSMGELQGWSPEQVAAKQADYVSKAWMQRITRYAYDDPVGAQGMYSQNIEQIQAADRPSLEHFLKENVQPVLARNIVQNVMGGNPVVDGDRLDDLHAAVRQAESRGNTAAVGPYVPGQGTAKGDMQVMDATNLNPGFGVRPAADNSAAERTRVGHDYLNAMIARYGGDQTLALAAYNWGPGNVDRLVQSAQSSGAPVSDAALVAKMPAETQKYVSAINAKVPPKVGAAPTSGDPRAHLADWQRQVSTLATQLYPNDPVFRDAALQNLDGQAGMVVKGQEWAQKNASEQLLAGAMNPDGTPRVSSLNDLLSSPDMKQAWAQLNPEQQIGVVRFLKEQANPPMNAHALQTIYTLQGMAQNDPIAFSSVNLMKYVGDMPYDELHKLMNLQATTDGRQARDQTKAMNLEHAMAVARPMLLASGVHIPNASSSPDKAADYNAFTGRMSQALDQFYTTNKRGPNDKELRDMSNSLLVQGAQSNTAGWFTSDKTVRAFQTDPSSFYVPVPPAEKPKIQAAFQQAFGRAPTDSEMQDFYTKYTIANSKGK